MWPARRRRPTPESPQAIAVFAPNLIGDTVMATPAFRAIRERFASSRVLLVARAHVAGVLDGAPWFDDRFLYNPRSSHAEERTWGLCARLRRERCGLAVLFPNSVRSALLANLSRISRRAGYNRGDRGWLLTDRLVPLGQQGRHRVPAPAVESYAKIVEHLGCNVSSLRTQLFVTPEEERAADRAWTRLGLPAKGRVISLNTGGAFGPAKNWPNESFARLAQRLVHEFSVSVLVLCGPAERANALEIVHRAAHPRVVSLANESISIGLSKASVRRSSLLITTDSGPRHFAGALGVPVISLFGPTHVAWTRTYHPNSWHVQVPVPCGPCQKPICPERHHRCMRDLNPDAVFAAAQEMLN
jgi:heptosyltransferase-2